MAAGDVHSFRECLQLKWIYIWWKLWLKTRILLVLLVVVLDSSCDLSLMKLLQVLSEHTSLALSPWEAPLVSAASLLLLTFPKCFCSCQTVKCTGSLHSEALCTRRCTSFIFLWFSCKINSFNMWSSQAAVSVTCTQFAFCISVLQ